jgi:hypothetical protein
VVPPEDVRVPAEPAPRPGTLLRGGTVEDGGGTPADSTTPSAPSVSPRTGQRPIEPGRTLTPAELVSPSALAPRPAAYEIAQAGGRHAGLLRRYLTKPDNEIMRALRSYERQVALHADKLSNPTKYVQNWASLDVREQQGLLNHWQQDLRRNQELADIMRGILQDRGVLP